MVKNMCIMNIADVKSFFFLVINIHFLIWLCYNGFTI